MADHQVEQGPDSEQPFQAAVDAADLLTAQGEAGVTQGNAEPLHPFQDAETREAPELREELEERQKHETWLQNNITRAESDTSYDDRVNAAREKLEAWNRKIDNGASEETKAKGQALIGEARQALETANAESYQPDPRLEAAVRAAEEKLAHWEKVVAYLEYPMSEKLRERVNKDHAGEPGYPKPDLVEPERPEGVKVSDRENYNAQEAKATGVTLKEDLSKAQTKLQTKEREFNDMKARNIRRKEEELSAAHTKARELEQREVDGWRAFARTLQSSVDSAEQLRNQNFRRMRRDHDELERVQAEIRRLQATLRLAEVNAPEEAEVAPEAGPDREEGHQS